jgi:hypothetical protein
MNNQDLQPIHPKKKFDPKLQEKRLSVPLTFMVRIEWTKSSIVEWVGVIFPTGKFLPNFDLKNMISTSTKDFSSKQLAKFARF